MVPTYRWQTPSITCRLGQSAAEHNHIIPQSNDYHETVPGNGNGRITCKEARRYGIAPVPRGHPAYPHMNDRDGDGVVCE